MKYVFDWIPIFETDFSVEIDQKAFECVQMYRNICVKLQRNAQKK